MAQAAAILDKPEFRLTIPARRSIFLIVFLCLWLSIWIPGGLFAFWAMVSPDTPDFARAFLFLWLMGWGLGLYVAGLAVGYMLMGRQVLEFGRDHITRYWKIWFPMRLRRFEIANLSDPQIVVKKSDDEDAPGDGADSAPISIGGGGLHRITVRDKGKQVVLLDNLSPQEAEAVLATITRLIGNRPAA